MYGVEEEVDRELHEVFRLAAQDRDEVVDDGAEVVDHDEEEEDHDEEEVDHDEEEVDHDGVQAHGVGDHDVVWVALLLSEKIFRFGAIIQVLSLEYSNFQEIPQLSNSFYNYFLVRIYNSSDSSSYEDTYICLLLSGEFQEEEEDPQEDDGKEEEEKEKEKEKEEEEEEEEEEEPGPIIKFSINDEYTVRITGNNFSAGNRKSCLLFIHLPGTEEDPDGAEYASDVETGNLPVTVINLTRAEFSIPSKFHNDMDSAHYILATLSWSDGSISRHPVLSSSPLPTYRYPVIFALAMCFIFIPLDMISIVSCMRRRSWWEHWWEQEKEKQQGR